MSAGSTIQSGSGLWHSVEEDFKDAAEGVCYVNLHATYIYIRMLFWQDWANTEGCLHRALAAYVHRRLSQNSGARLGSDIICIALSMSVAKSCETGPREDVHAQANRGTRPGRA